MKPNLKVSAHGERPPEAPLQDVGLAEGLLEVVLHLVQREPELGRLVFIWSYKVTMSEVAKP